MHENHKNAKFYINEKSNQSKYDIHHGVKNNARPKLTGLSGLAKWRPVKADKFFFQGSRVGQKLTNKSIVQDDDKYQHLLATLA